VKLGLRAPADPSELSAIQVAAALAIMVGGLVTVFGIAWWIAV
jgi:hypothetical protein